MDSMMNEENDMARRAPVPPIMTEAAQRYFEELDERKARQRYFDQPGQWADTTPPEVKKRQEEASEALETQLEGNNKAGQP